MSIFSTLVQFRKVILSKLNVNMLLLVSYENSLIEVLAFDWRCLYTVQYMPSLLPGSMFSSAEEGTLFRNCGKVKNYLKHRFFQAESKLYNVLE